MWLPHHSGKYCIILQLRLFYKASSVSLMVNCVMAKCNPKICSMQLPNKPEIHKLLNVMVGLLIMDYNNFILQWLNTNPVLQIRYFLLFIFLLFYLEGTKISTIQSDWSVTYEECVFISVWQSRVFSQRVIRSFS